MAGALLLRVLRWMVEREFQGAGFLPLISSTLTIGGKLPPAPAYVLFYCGAGLAISAVLFAIASSRSGMVVAAPAAVLGRASLFVFIFQYFIFWTLPDLLGISPDSANLVAVFVLGVVVNWVAAWCWDRAGGNRLLTLGIKQPKRKPPTEGIPPDANGREMLS
jgi:fucose 4-O-acetylase-like acetyltransferase